MLRDLRSAFSGEGAFGAELRPEEIVEGLAAIIRPHMAEDFVCVMDGGALTTEYRGLDGLRTGWLDFLGAFETLTIEPEGEMREGPDGECVVEFVRLSGKPKGLDAAVDAAAAGVWRMRGEKLAAVEFHMDRDRALRSAGLDPGA